MFKYNEVIKTNMVISEKELLVKFARELREIVESFEEEAEILASEEIVKEIQESEIAYREGDVKRFKDINELKREIDI